MENKSIEKIGEKIGFIFAYFLFITILFFLLKLINKLPTNWTYYHVMGIVLLIVLIGMGIKRLLK